MSTPDEERAEKSGIGLDGPTQAVIDPSMQLLPIRGGGGDLGLHGVIISFRF